MSRKRKIAAGIALALLLAMLFYRDLVVYGVQQAAGQWRVLHAARPVEEVLADPAFPDSLKQNLQLVPVIRAFAFDSLGLQPNDNYTTVYDQQGKDILWVVTACQPYRLEPLTWSFPLIGSFTYKGFFDQDKANNLANDLQAQGYDVEVQAVSGWSTLGWFDDPLLSNMLAGSPGELAGTLIHELTHGTVFVPDSMTFNENLATFIGRQGALHFLASTFGDTSTVYRHYDQRLHDSRLFTRHIVRGAHYLDSLYKRIEQLPEQEKAQFKKQAIDRIITTLDTVAFYQPQRYRTYFAAERPNNAFFVSFLNYRERQDEFEALLQDSCRGQLAEFVAYWRQRYPH